MSYCSPPWISDYNYQAILEQVALVNASASPEPFRVGRPAQTWARVLVTAKGVRWSRSLTSEGAPSSLPEPGLISDTSRAELAQVTVYRRKIAESSAFMLFGPPQEPCWHAVGIE